MGDPELDLETEMMLVDKTVLFRAVLGHFSPVQFFATPWTVAHLAPLSMGFSRQEYWRGLPCPPPRDLPNISCISSIAGGFFTPPEDCCNLN